MPFQPQDLQVVFITYNRSELLAETVRLFRAVPGFKGIALICSDDGSAPEHQERIKSLNFDHVAWAPRNGGLGRNNNKGLKASTSKYQLMVQDDCVVVDPEAVFKAVAVLEADPTIGMVRLNGDATHFPLTQRRAGNVDYWVVEHTSQAYAELKAQPVRRRAYSDQPHIRRRELHESAVGYYAEGVPMERTEMDYEDRLDAQSSLFVAFLDPGHVNYFTHLDHIHSFRTSNLRNRMDQALMGVVNGLGLRKLPFFTAARGAYRGFQALLEKLGLSR